MYRSLLKAVMTNNNYACDVKSITTYTNQYTTRSKTAGIA